MSTGLSIFKILDIWWRKSIKNTGYMQDFLNKYISLVFFLFLSKTETTFQTKKTKNVDAKKRVGICLQGWEGEESEKVAAEVPVSCE